LYGVVAHATSNNMVNATTIKKAYAGVLKVLCRMEYLLRAIARADRCL
jgi:hypothetical protein